MDKKPENLDDLLNSIMKKIEDNDLNYADIFNSLKLNPSIEDEIRELLNKNKDLYELLESRKYSFRDAVDHKYRYFSETKSDDFYAINKYGSYNKIPKQIRDEITDALFFIDRDRLILNKIKFRKFVDIFNDISYVDHSFLFPEPTSNFFYLKMNFISENDEFVLELNSKFEITLYANAQNTSTFYHFSQVMTKLLELNNLEINKAYFELFVFNKPIKNEMKELLLLNTDIDMGFLDKFGYDFRKDAISPKSLLKVDVKKLKT